MTPPPLPAMWTSYLEAPLIRKSLEIWLNNPNVVHNCHIDCDPLPCVGRVPALRAQWLMPPSEENWALNYARPLFHRRRRVLGEHKGVRRTAQSPDLVARLFGRESRNLFQTLSSRTARGGLRTRPRNRAFLCSQKPASLPARPIASRYPNFPSRPKMPLARRCGRWQRSKHQYLDSRQGKKSLKPIPYYSVCHTGPI